MILSQRGCIQWKPVNRNSADVFRFINDIFYNWPQTTSLFDFYRPI